MSKIIDHPTRYLGRNGVSDIELALLDRICLVGGFASLAEIKPHSYEREYGEPPHGFYSGDWRKWLHMGQGVSDAFSNPLKRGDLFLYFEPILSFEYYHIRVSLPKHGFDTNNIKFVLTASGRRRIQDAHTR